MADQKISALTGAATPLAGTEVLPIVQSGATVKVSVANLTVGRAVSALSLTSTNDASINGLTVGKGASSVATNTAVGTEAAFSNTTAPKSTYVGYQAGYSNASGDNLTVLGYRAGFLNSTGIHNVCVGTSDGSFGYAAGYSTTSGAYNVSVGNGAAGANSIGSNNTCIGYQAGVRLTTGNSNTLIGGYQGAAAMAGQVTLSDGSGNKRIDIDSSGIVTMPAYGAGAATFSAAGVISSVSDENWKIKDGIPSNPTEMLGKLEPGYWYYNDEKKATFGLDRQLGFYAQNVNAAIGPEAAPEPESFTVTDDQGVESLQQKPWGYYDRSVLAVVVMALQEALATVKALEVRIQALEVKS
jgi:hypothetical protein